MGRWVREWCRRHGLGLSTALAFLTRFPVLGFAELSIDETWTWYTTKQVLATGEFWRTVALGADAPLFVAANVMWARIFGLSVGGLRAPAALFGTLSVSLIYLLLKRRRPDVALPVALLAAVSPFLVFYSKDARPYAQLLFFALVFTSSFDKTSAPRSRKQRIWLGLWAGCAVASHYYAVVFLAAFFTVILATHVRANRRAELRDDLRTGAYILVATSPLLIYMLRGLGNVSVPYWLLAGVDIPGILVEQFLFLGTTLAGGETFATIANVVIAALVILPLILAIRRRNEILTTTPLIVSLWWVAPVLIDVAGIVVGANLLFYPRGFIPTTPFLLTYWVVYTREMRLSAWARRAYQAVLIVPFVLNGLMVSIQHPAQPYFRGRAVLGDVARDVERLRDEYDIILIHHWWMAQCYYYFLSEPATVWPLGLGYEGDTGPVEDLENVPPEARVLLVVNDLAAGYSDPDGAVVEALRAQRPLVRERACLYPRVQGSKLLCSRVYVFGPVAP